MIDQEIANEEKLWAQYGKLNADLKRINLMINQLEQQLGQIHLAKQNQKQVVEPEIVKEQ